MLSLVLIGFVGPGKVVRRVGHPMSKKQAGFSLIELLIVVAIILIVAAIAIPNLMASRMAANEASAYKVFVPFSRQKQPMRLPIRPRAFLRPWRISAMAAQARAWPPHRKPA